MPIASTETIKRRMIRNASKIWGFQDAQDINSFDPVLGLLIGALADEIQKVSNEINNTDSRLIEKLLELLFSQNNYTHFPAHAVGHSRPIQAQAAINPNYSFRLEKSFSGKKEGTVEKKTIYFTPTGVGNLFNAEIHYLLSGKHLYEIDGQYKEILSRVSEGSKPDFSKLIFGIKCDPLIERLDGLNLFFSLKNIQNEERFYQLLHSATWKINEITVEFDIGFGNRKHNNENALQQLIKKDTDISYKSLAYVNDFYGKKFMSLGANNYYKKDFVKDAAVPQRMAELIETGKIENNSDILWLEMDLKHPISEEDISDLSVSLNCFPLVNRELNDVTYSIYEGINVIPLSSNDLFYDIKNVSDSENKEYLPAINVHNGEQNTYHLRQGGVARFDSRDARETISNLINLVRDEAAAFSLGGTDLVSEELKELEQILSRLEQRVNRSSIAKDLNSYIILKSKSNYNKVTVQYWSIVGDMANNIRPGTKLDLYRGGDFDSKHIALITKTIGGKQKLSKDEKLNSLRRALLSKGRIVTIEDIKALCFEQFGNEITGVEVKKGISLNPTPGKGMSRTLDIYLSLKKNTKLSKEDIWLKSEGLKIHLKQESVNLLPYRVFTD